MVGLPDCLCLVHLALVGVLEERCRRLLATVERLASARERQRDLIDQQNDVLLSGAVNLRVRGDPACG